MTSTTGNPLLDAHVGNVADAIERYTNPDAHVTGSGGAERVRRGAERDVLQYAAAALGQAHVLGVDLDQLAEVTLAYRTVREAQLREEVRQVLADVAAAGADLDGAGRPGYGTDVLLGATIAAEPEAVLQATARIRFEREPLPWDPSHTGATLTSSAA